VSEELLAVLTVAVVVMVVGVEVVRREASYLQGAVPCNHLVQAQAQARSQLLLSLQPPARRLSRLNPPSSQSLILPRQCVTIPS
jgi:hypothetical protein